MFLYVILFLLIASTSVEDLNDGAGSSCGNLTSCYDCRGTSGCSWASCNDTSSNVTKLCVASDAMPAMCTEEDCSTNNTCLTYPTCEQCTVGNCTWGVCGEGNPTCMTDAQVAADTCSPSACKLHLKSLVKVISTDKV